MKKISQNAIVSCAMEIEENSYFHNRTTTLPYSVKWTVLKSGSRKLHKFMFEGLQ